MKQEAQIRALIDFAGWKVVSPSPLVVIYERNSRQEISRVLGDYNLLHNAEMHLDDEQLLNYARELDERFLCNKYDKLFKVRTAAWHVCVEALVKAIGKWESESAQPDSPQHASYVCHNCGRTFLSLDELARVFPNIPDLVARLDIGGEVPAGECACESLVYKIQAGDQQSLCGCPIICVDSKRRQISYYDASGLLLMPATDYDDLDKALQTAYRWFEDKSFGSPNVHFAQPVES